MISFLLHACAAFFLVLTALRVSKAVSSKTWKEFLFVSLEAFYALFFFCFSLVLIQNPDLGKREPPSCTCEK